MPGGRGGFRPTVVSASKAPAPQCVPHESHGDDACCDASYVPDYDENRPLRVRLYAQSLSRLEKGNEWNKQAEQKAADSGCLRYVPHQPHRPTKHEGRDSPHGNLTSAGGVRFHSGWD